MKAAEVRVQLEAIYRSGVQRFVRTACAITGDRDSAAEAVHDAFVGLIRGAEGFRGEAPVEAWAWRAVINSALRIRRDRVAAPFVAAEQRPSSTNGGSGEDLAELRAAVAGLPERQRLVLFLRYYADLEYRAIAETLGIAQGTVAASLNASHAAIREQITKEVSNDRT